RHFSHKEYIDASTELCSAAKDVSPALTARLFAAWFSASGPLSGLRHEYETYEFDAGNFVIRHLFAHFLALQEDKSKRPELFCCPGAWLAGENLESESERIFLKHQALFFDKEDDESIYPRIQPERPEALVHKAYETFYQHSIVFDLTNQWISQSGP